MEVKEGRRILDAYCGTGSIAINVAGRDYSVIGVDEFTPSIKDARNNARLNKLTNCRFYAGACEKVIPGLNQEFDAVILDPPRAGCHKDLLQVLNAMQVPQIIYVFCNPATLARDIKILCDSSYKIISVPGGHVPLDRAYGSRNPVATAVTLTLQGLTRLRQEIYFDVSEFPHVFSFW